MSGASSGNQTTSDDDGDNDFPVAAIVCLGVGAYVILIVGIIILKHYCSSRGACKSHCCDATTEEGGVCSYNCCARANEACPCCCKCNLDGCLSKVCGKPKKINCIDVLLCNCGGCTERMCNSFKCCGCCPKDIKCNACAGACTDCCDSPDSEPGTCGCLCLEVKLRSPRGGSTRRSISAPPVIQEEHLRQFNTHSGPRKNTLSVSNGKLSPVIRRNNFLKGDGDSVLSQYSVIGHQSINRSNNNTEMKLTSSSPRSKHFQMDSYNARGSPLERDKDGRQRSRKSSHNNMNDVNNSNDSIEMSRTTSNRRKSSKLRKSIRSGQRSQRFPNQMLVKSDSLNSNSNTEQPKRLKSLDRSLPEPSRGHRRPLPAIRKANKTQ